MAREETPSGSPRDDQRGFLFAVHPALIRRHPVWSDRPYVVFCYDPPGVEGRVKYIQQNPEKEGLLPQHFPLLLPYDGWPYTHGPKHK